jgi:hypothetical protein
MSLSKHNLFGQVLDLKITDILSEKFELDSENKLWKLPHCLIPK